MTTCHSNEAKSFIKHKRVIASRNRLKLMPLFQKGSSPVNLLCDLLYDCLLLLFSTVSDQFLSIYSSTWSLINICYKISHSMGETTYFFPAGNYWSRLTFFASVSRIQQEPSVAKMSTCICNNKTSASIFHSNFQSNHKYGYFIT